MGDINKKKLLDVWEKLNEQLLFFIKKRIKNQEDSEDILQEVYIKLHENINSLREEEKIVSWIYQITRNTINNCYRKCYKFKNIEFQEKYMELTSEEEINLNNEIIEVIKEFIENLPKDYKEVIKFYEFDNLTHKELGDILGIKENTSKSKLKRGKAKLKQLLDECCVFQIDKFGNILDYQKKEK